MQQPVRFLVRCMYIEVNAMSSCNLNEIYSNICIRLSSVESSSYGLS